MTLEAQFFLYIISGILTIIAGYEIFGNKSLKFYKEAFKTNADEIKRLKQMHILFKEEIKSLVMQNHYLKIIKDSTIAPKEDKNTRGSGMTTFPIYSDDDKVKSDIDSLINSLKILDKKIQETGFITSSIPFSKLHERISNIEKLLTKK